MFGFRNKREPVQSAQGAGQSGKDHPVIAALMLESDVFDLTAVEGMVRKNAFAGHVPTEIQQMSGNLLFKLGDSIVAVAPMPAPYPWSDLKGPCETSWMWPKERPAITLEKHRRHVLITKVGGSLGIIPGRLAITKLAALASDQPGVLGVLWPEGTIVHYPPLFRDFAAEISTLDQPPLMLWVDFRIFRNEDGTSGMFTTGLAALGGMEVEIPRIDMPPGDLREWAMNIASYLLDKDNHVKDGDTMGVDATHQIKIRFTDSKFGKGGKVMQFQT